MLTYNKSNTKKTNIFYKLNIKQIYTFSELINKFFFITKNKKEKEIEIKEIKEKEIEINNIKKWDSFIKKKIRYELYNIGNDFYYKFMFNNKLALNSVMNEINTCVINTSCKINTNKLLIYLIRIWNYFDNEYAFKIGYTNNLSERLLKINQTYNCNWRIIIMMCGNIDDKKIEKQIHDKLKRVSPLAPKIMGNPINNKPKELYNISWALYNDFAEIMKNMKIECFESIDYLYDDSCNIEKIYDDQMDGIELLVDEDDFITLDQGINENKYWLFKQKYLY